MSSPDPNPYAPPKAPVSDVPPETVARPRDVSLAVRLLWISLGIGLFGLFVEPEVRANALTVVIVMAVVLGSVAAWINIKIASGRNWARITYLILAILGYGLTAATWNSDAADPPSSLFLVIINVVGAALDVWILYLLFKRTSGDWFRQRVSR